jgi:hypothetical protein
LEARPLVAVEADVLYAGSLLLGVVDARAADLDGGCASRRETRDPWRVEASGGRMVACMAWATILCPRCGEVIGSVNASQRRRCDF